MQGTRGLYSSALQVKSSKSFTVNRHNEEFGHILHIHELDAVAIASFATQNTGVLACLSRCTHVRLSAMAFRSFW